MILQYSNGITDCYEEAQSISIGSISVDNDLKTSDIIQIINNEIKTIWGEQSFELRTDKLVSKDSKMVKFAIINTERSKEKVLLFNDYTVLYLLNEKGKTLKIF